MRQGTEPHGLACGKPRCQKIIDGVGKTGEINNAKTINITSNNIEIIVRRKVYADHPNESVYAPIKKYYSYDSTGALKKEGSFPTSNSDTDTSIPVYPNGKIKITHSSDRYFIIKNSETKQIVDDRKCSTLIIHIPSNIPRDAVIKITGYNYNSLNHNDDVYGYSQWLAPCPSYSFE